MPTEAYQIRPTCTQAGFWQPLESRFYQTIEDAKGLLIEPLVNLIRRVLTSYGAMSFVVMQQKAGIFPPNSSDIQHRIVYPIPSFVQRLRIYVVALEFEQGIPFPDSTEPLDAIYFLIWACQMTTSWSSLKNGRRSTTIPGIMLTWTRAVCTTHTNELW